MNSKYHKTVKRKYDETIVHHEQNFCNSKALWGFESTLDQEKITCVGCLASVMWRRNKKIMDYQDCLNRARVLVEAKLTVERARIE
jgi:hypothetical protein